MAGLILRRKSLEYFYLLIENKTYVNKTAMPGCWQYYSLAPAGLPQ